LSSLEIVGGDGIEFSTKQFHFIPPSSSSRFYLFEIYADEGRNDNNKKILALLHEKKKSQYWLNVIMYVIT
jgi:hypothetical protein